MLFKEERRSLLKKTGMFLLFMRFLPAWKRKDAGLYVVDFVTLFPEQISLQEYRQFKSEVQDQKKANELMAFFKKEGKILDTDYNFFGSHSIWTVSFYSEEDFNEWMILSDKLNIHFQSAREERGYKFRIQPRS